MCTGASRRAGHAVKHVIVSDRSLSCPDAGTSGRGYGGNVELSEVDLVNRDTYVQGIPHEMFEVLRHEAPVFWHEEADGRGFWAVTRYQDVVAVNRDNELYSSARGSALIMDQPEDMLAQQRLMMLNMDPPMHTRYRLLGGEGPRDAVAPEAGMEASLGLYPLANRAARGKRASPSDDIICVLLHAEVDGESLSELEFDLFFLLLSVAGNETTRNLISHGMLALIEHPDQRARLLRDPSLLSGAVEEMLRFGTPVMHFRRTASRDTEIAGQPVAEGDKVVIWYVSANRDENVFPDPHRFDVERSPNEHVAFGGGGPHFCLGANLARMEIRALFDAVLRRLPDMELAGPVERLRSNFIHGIKHMPVSFTPAPARR